MYKKCWTKWYTNYKHLRAILNFQGLQFLRSESDRISGRTVELRTPTVAPVRALVSYFRKLLLKFSPLQPIKSTPHDLELAILTSRTHIFFGVSLPPMSLFFKHLTIQNFPSRPYLQNHYNTHAAPSTTSFTFGNHAQYDPNCHAYPHPPTLFFSNITLFLLKALS